MTRALHEAGAGLMAGSDSPQFFMAPGFALHRELAALARAGLSPFEALATATRNPARYLGASARLGVVAEGREADLVLLEANPLADVANARRVVGVMLDGRWHDAERIAALTDSVAAAANPGSVSGGFVPETTRFAAGARRLVP
jgi:imidazolonepropionase-like amidohydrolase